MTLIWRFADVLIHGVLEQKSPTSPTGRLVDWSFYIGHYDWKLELDYHFDYSVLYFGVRFTEDWTLEERHPNGGCCTEGSDYRTYLLTYWSAMIQGYCSFSMLYQYLSYFVWINLNYRLWCTTTGGDASALLLAILSILLQSFNCCCCCCCCGCGCGCGCGCVFPTWSHFRKNLSLHTKTAPDQQFPTGPTLTPKGVCWHIAPSCMFCSGKLNL